MAKIVYQPCKLTLGNNQSSNPWDIFSFSLCSFQLPSMADHPNAFKRIFELESSIEDMQLTMQEADQAAANLESKIAARRARNPLEPIPFELFADFCRDCIEKGKVATEGVRHQIRKANAELRFKRAQVEEKRNLAGGDSAMVEHESLTIQWQDTEKNLKSVTKSHHDLVVLGGEVKRNTTQKKLTLAKTMRQYGQVRADCIRQRKNLKQLEKQIDQTEEDIRELEAIIWALEETRQRYRAPDVMDIARKIEELEQEEKELMGVTKEKLAELQ